MGKKLLNLTALLIAIFFTTGWAQRETTDVRLTRIEESIKAMNQRFDALDKRMDDHNVSLNKRIDDTNQRIEAGFDRQTNLLITVMGLLAAAMGVVVSVVVWFARQERPVSKKHYDKLLQQDQALGEQFDDLEKELENRTRRSTQQERLNDELAQKLRALEAEIAALKRPAT
jgi:peptidoglycan hydrolase CwlO-like protein